MFNKSVSVYAPQGDKHVTIHEHKAPTDASIALLKELEEVARAKILASFKLELNTIKGTVHVMFSDMDDEYNILFQYNINGQEYRTLTTITRTLYKKEDSFWRDKVWNDLSKDIARQLLIKTAPNLKRISA